MVGWPSYAARMEYYRPEHVASSGTSSDKFYSCFGGISGPGESSGLKNPRPVGLKNEFSNLSQNMIFQIQPLRVVGSSPNFVCVYSRVLSIRSVTTSSDKFYYVFGSFPVPGGGRNLRPVELKNEFWSWCRHQDKGRSHQVS